MPELIVIKMYFADHAPPHFRAEYADFEARIAIETLAVLSGNLPARAMGLVVEWATRHPQPALAADGASAKIVARRG